MTDSAAAIPEVQQSGTTEKSGIGTGLATAAVIGLGAALIEVELIPGLLLGVAAMAFPKLVPSVGRSVRPFMHSAIKAGYKATHKTREWMAEAGEQVSDMVAEVRASSMDDDAPAKTVIVGAPSHVSSVNAVGVSPVGVSSAFETPAKV